MAVRVARCTEATENEVLPFFLRSRRSARCPARTAIYFPPPRSGGRCRESEANEAEGAFAAKRRAPRAHHDQQPAASSRRIPSRKPRSATRNFSQHQTEWIAS